MVMKGIILLFGLTIRRELVTLLVWVGLINRSDSRPLGEFLFYLKFLGNERGWLFFGYLWIPTWKNGRNSLKNRFFWRFFRNLDSRTAARNPWFLVRYLLLVFGGFLGEIFLVLSQNDLNNVLILRLDDLVLSLVFYGLNEVFGELRRSRRVYFDKSILLSFLNLFLGVFCKHFAYFLL